MTRTLQLFIIVLTAVNFVALPMALAQQSQSKSTGKKKVVYEKETVLRFDGTTIEGNVLKPDGFYLLRKGPKQWQDLVKVRQNFNQELKNMKNDL